MSERPRTQLIFALSGLGKTTLCLRHPAVTYDTDVALHEALARAFPELPTRERLVAWRCLAQSEPWSDHQGQPFRLWASTRRRFIGTVLEALAHPTPRLVLTNMTLIPWRYDHYVGVELGSYEEHWDLLERPRDNDQVEARNNHLEGFAPLTRMPPGHFLSEQDNIQSALAGLYNHQGGS